jgi:hypothetical protein
MGSTDNLTSLHNHEEELRARSLAAIEADTALSDHWHLVSEAMNVIYAFTHDRAVGSMTEFKQIVGRGTRVHEDSKKFYFTLIDFRGATSHFADPDFDGDPVQIYEPGEGDSRRSWDR